MIRNYSCQVKLENTFFFNVGLNVALKATIFAICDETNNVSFFIKFLYVRMTLDSLFQCLSVHVKSM